MRKFDCKKFPEKEREVFYKDFNGVRNNVEVRWSLLEDDDNTLWEIWLLENGFNNKEDILIWYRK